MADPITLGALIATALASGASEAGKAALGAAAKDAYEALKSATRRLLGPAAEQLESRPDSNPRAVAKLADDLPETDRNGLATLAEALSRALVAEGRGERLAQTINQFYNTGSGQQFNAPGGTITLGSDALKPRT